jgi:hypothetical protein
MPDAVHCVLTGYPLRSGSRARRARLRPFTGTQGPSPAPLRPPAYAPPPAGRQAREARQGARQAPGVARKAQGKRPPARRGPGKASGPPPAKANGPKEGARLLSAGAGMMREGYRARETFTCAPIAYPCGKRSKASQRAKRRETVSTCASASVFPARITRTRQRCTLGFKRASPQSGRRPHLPLAARGLRILAPPGFPGGFRPLARLLPRNSPA